MDIGKWTEQNTLKENLLSSDPALETIEFFTKAIEANPNDKDAYFRRGITCRPVCGFSVRDEMSSWKTILMLSRTSFSDRGCF